MIYHYNLRKLNQVVIILMITMVFGLAVGFSVLKKDVQIPDFKERSAESKPQKPVQEIISGDISKFILFHFID